MLEYQILEADQEDPAFRQAMDAGLARAKAAAKARRKAKRNPFATWIRKKTCRLNYGKKYPGTRPIPQLDAETLIKLYRRNRYGASINIDQYQRHFDGLDTLYSWADHCTGNPEIMVMIDIDAGATHGGGTKEGAWKFAKVVEQLFPGIHSEPSTNGEGVHSYPVISKKGVDARRIKHALRNLQVYLRELATFVGADIKCVEVKGGPPDVKYDHLTGDITDIVFGQLAKIPRQAAVMKTCTIKFDDMAMLDVADIPGKFADLAAPDYCMSGPPLARSARCALDPTSTSSSSIAPQSKKHVGSHDTRIIRQDVIDALPNLENYAARLLYQWIGETQLKADRWLVTPLDLAQFFSVMMALSKDDDGFASRFKADMGDALPVRQIGNLWQAAFKDGDFARPFNHHRFKAIRDMLSKHGHINWIDNRFFNFPDQKGKKKRDGWCCKWRLGESLRSVLESLKYTPPTSVDTTELLPDGEYEFHVPTFSQTIYWQHERAWIQKAEDDIDKFFASKAA